MSLKDVINNNLVDYLIDEILQDNKTYEDLGYWDKTSLCKLVVKKENNKSKAIC